MFGKLTNVYPVVRGFGSLAFMALAFIVFSPLFQLNLARLDVVPYTVVLLFVGFVAGMVTRSYWTVAMLPPLATVALMVPFVLQHPEVSNLSQGQFPAHSTVVHGIGILVMVVPWVLLGFYFLFTPGVIAGVWTGRGLVRRQPF